MRWDFSKLLKYKLTTNTSWGLKKFFPDFLGLLQAENLTDNKFFEYCRTHNLLQVPIAELAERWTELPQVSDESRSFFRVHTGYFSNIPKCIKAEFIASWGCSQSSVVSSSQR
ncbi:hypothetical protein TNCV_1788501 [Trichonephila clavipes]|nr:hypothetical protein TNCV_1788501 [Trichonephila clavipes]